MSDLAKVKRNIQRMIDQNAPEADIDAYVASEGTTPEELRGEAQAQAAAPSQPSGGGFDQFQQMLQAGQIEQPTFDLGRNFQALDDVVRTTANGATFGMADRLAGYMNNTGTEAERERSEGAKERLGPVMAPVAEIGGSMLPVAKLMQVGATATRLPGALRAAGGAIDGAVFGGAQAVGYGNDIQEGATAGALFGAGGQLISKGLGKGLEYFKKPVSTSKELKDISTAAFKEADDAGVVFTPNLVNKVLNKVRGEFAAKGFHPENEPGAWVAFKELERLSQGGNVNLTGIKTAREVASGGYRPQNEKNNMLIGKVINILDDAVQNPGADDVLMGDAAKGSAALKKARDYWARKSKMEMVDKLLAKAETRAGSTGSGGNAENASRQNLRKILDSDKAGRGFSGDEKKAVEKAVMGSKTQNAIRLAGKLSPQGSGLMAALLLGGTAAAPQIAIPVAAAGMVSKKLSEALTKASAKEVKDLIAVGGSRANLPQKLSAAQKSLLEAMAKALAITGTTNAMQQQN